ncbi:MAG: uroporphyrinogen decarboxylase family protein [Candidatus Zipacnadales bacterium]
MTSRERILTAIHHEQPDRVPISPFGLGRLEYESEAAKRLIALTDPFIEAPVLGGDPFLGTAVKVSTEQNGDLTTTTYHTPAGDLVLQRRRTSVTSATVEFPLKSVADIDKLLSIPYEPPEPDVSLFLERKREIGEEGFVLAGLGDAICLPATMFSPEDFCLCWADVPEALEHMVEVAAQRLNRWVEKASAAGVDGWRIVGGEYASVQLGPEAFRRLVVKYDRVLVDIMRHYGAISYFHNHGPTMRYLDDFVDIGSDAVDPFEAPPWGDCNLQAVMERIGDRVCLVGNLDDMEIIEKRSREEVQTIARERLEAAGPRSFCLGGTASGTYTEKGAENFIAMVEVAEDYARSGG